MIELYNEFVYRVECRACQIEVILIKNFERHVEESLHYHSI